MVAEATLIDLSSLVTTLGGLISVSELVTIMGGILAITVVFTITRRLITKFAKMFTGSVSGGGRRR